MGLLELPFAYLIWHYTLAVKQIAKLWVGFAWYILNFFSVFLLLKTLFAPWKRMTESGGRNKLEQVAEAFVINLMSRFVGAAIRVPIICIGFASVVLSVVGLVAVYVVWIGLPLILFALLTYGFALYV